MTRDELWAKFSVAWQKGWKIEKEDLPKEIPGRFFPEPDALFKALELISPSEVRFLVLGQDPYFNPKEATGIAFAVPSDYTPIPPSLRNIMKYVYREGEGDTSLVHWVERKKVLLLNAALTVPRPAAAQKGRDGCAGTHLPRWEDFLGAVVRQLMRANPGVQMVAWGRRTQDSLSKALGDERLKCKSIAWCYHPAASIKNTDACSFASFWKTDVGKSLSFRYE